MKLSDLIHGNLSHFNPQGLIIIQTNQNKFRAQRVYYQTGSLDLGVILLAYYRSETKVKELSQLADCLKIGHYLMAPPIFKYGHYFERNSRFKSLPNKKRKHLVSEISDCTISLKRDHYPSKIKPVKSQPNLKNLLRTNYKYSNIYLYQNQTWFKIAKSTQDFKIINIRKLIQKQLNQKSQDQKIDLVLGKVCPSCHYIVPAKAHFCYHCGLNFEHHARCAIIDAGHNHFPTMKRTKTCPNCKRKISVVNQYCNYCGHDFD